MKLRINNLSVNKFINRKANEVEKSYRYISNVFITRSRQTIVSTAMVGHTFKIHNGSRYFETTIMPTMINQKLGDFVFTKKIGKEVHSDNKIQAKHEKKMFAQRQRKNQKQKRRVVKKKYRAPISGQASTKN